MGFFGGELAYRFLKKFYPGGQGVPMPAGDLFEEQETSKLALFFGESIYQEFQDKVVADFGCGPGWTCIDLALHGARHVVGLDIVPQHLQNGRALAEKYRVADKCSFRETAQEKVDVVLSMDAFEHFADPAAILSSMRDVLKDDGCAFVTFGYTWYHPLGGHLFSVFPWAHLLFTEESLIRWRSDFKTDGATRYGEVAGGLNQMTVGRWEKLVAASPFDTAWHRTRPIRAARFFYCSLTREFLTSTLQWKLVPKKT